MDTIKLYQVDAFTDKIFGGNPAAVCPLDKWPPDDIMQNIAMENNLAETAFYVNEPEGLRIRWFTPLLEVDLCGHATLAAAYVLYHHENFKGETITFNSRSGKLNVSRNEDWLTLDFPTDDIAEIEFTPELVSCFNHKPVKAFKGKTDYMLVFNSEAEIKTLIPDFNKITFLKNRGVIATAKGETEDFVSRFFAPYAGVNEDPVTGSAHTTLTPYWSAILNKKELTARQLSPRRGYLKCKYLGNRTEISGQAKLYLTGVISI